MVFLLCIIVQIFSSACTSLFDIDNGTTPKISNLLRLFDTMATLYSYFYHVKQHIHNAISFSYAAINLSLVLGQRFVSSPPKFTFFKSYHYQCQAAIYLARYG